MKRKYLSLILAVVMVLGTLTTVANAAPTNNVKVDWLIEKGFVEGYADGTYGLEKTITRAEVATMVVRTLGKEEDAVKSMNIISLFTDMNTSDVLWSRGYVTIAAFEGIVNGYLDGTFGPKKDITYAEVATMLVRVLGGLNKDEEKLATGVNWATIYLTKANQLGIFEGVEVSDYSALAVRGKIFEMVYNVISKTPDTGLEAYKGIVIENTRVSGLDKGEIAIEVIEKSTGAATHRYDTGSNVRIKLKDLKEDTNYLLGKVVDVTINESNEATRLTIDNSYSYITGQTVFNKDELTINDKTYGLRDTNKYSNSFDKLAAVYHNDKEYRDYKDYFDKVANRKEFSNDFSNVTMKGNSILFIDSFTFEDISPVKEVLNSGEEVHVYRDDNNGTVTRFYPMNVIGFTADGLKSMNIKDIKANDVVHIYDRDNAIVRTDAVSTGIFNSYREDSTNSYIQLDGKNHLVVEVDKRRPVYSLDGTRFFTLFASRGDLDLEHLRGEKVTVLLDANGKLQSIVGDIKYDEGVFVIDETTRRSANVIGPNNGTATVVIDYGSLLNFLSSKDNKSIEDFHRGDLVYLMKDGNRVDKMTRMATAATINSQAKSVVKGSKGYFEMNKSWIRLEEARNLTSTFQINNANVFIIEVDGTKVPKIQGATLDEILDNAKTNSDLKAYIITNRDFNIMNLGNSIKVGNEADVAHTIIFTNFETTTSNLTKEVLELTFKYTPNRNNMIEGKDMYGSTFARNVDKYANVPELLPGDIVELAIDKDNVVQEAMIKIRKNDDKFTVIEIDRYSSTRARRVVLEDNKKVRKTYYIMRDALEFGEVREGDKVSINLNSYGDIDVIIVK